MRISIAWLIVLVSCGGGKGGGGSGIPSGTLIVDLDSQQITDLCESLIENAPPPRTVSCPTGGEQVVDPGTVAECVTEIEEDQVTFAECGITVGELEGCFQAVSDRSDAEVCDDESIPAECAPLLECL